MLSLPLPAFSCVVSAPSLRESKCRTQSTFFFFFFWWKVPVRGDSTAVVEEPAETLQPC